MSSQIGEPRKTKYFAEFSRKIRVLGDQRVLDEKYVASGDIVKMVDFPKLGLTDSGIADVAANGACLVVTDDFRLYGFLSQTGVDVLNFNHIRDLS